MAITHQHMSALTIAIAMAAPAHAQCSGHWDPTVSAIGVVPVPSILLGMARLPNGDVAVSGTFATVAGAASNGLAVYSPTSNTWRALGADLRLPSGNIAVAPDGTIVGIHGIAGATYELHRFDPVSQSFTTSQFSVGDGCGGVATTVAAQPDASVIVGAGTECETFVMRRDAVTGVWAMLGDPVNVAYEMASSCGPTAMAVFPNGQIAIATNCTEMIHCCSWQATHVAVYDPPTGVWRRVFSAVTNGLVGPSAPYPFQVRALLPIANGDLVVGGDFTQFNGTVMASHVARYDTQSNQWMPLGSGLASAVSRLAMLANGNIVAATSDGLFEFRQGAAGWTQIQPALGGTVTDMLGMPGGNLLVAGYAGIWPNQTPIFASYIPACLADVNCSGGLSGQDIFDFLNAWFANNPDADFNGSGLSVQDIFDFLNAWFAGC